MVNAIRGEIGAKLDGKEWTLCLTLGALAHLENEMRIGSLNALADRISGGELKSSDLLSIIHAGLLGGGYTLSKEEVAEMRVEGGISGYANIVANLMRATFLPKETESDLTEVTSPKK